jgi:tricorn protease
LGYDFTRWGTPTPYFYEAPRGQVVAVTDENAGSDGDIFSHAFKMMQLGPLVGTRTWGGVVGIDPYIPLVDGTQTTQPEFSFWFRDVGWGVENYGTDPTIPVEYPPQAYVAGTDPQLARAIQEALNLIEQRPVETPTPEPRPNRGFSR